MGLDLGIKVPAVGITDTMKVRFFGNGRQDRFYRTRFYSHFKRLQRQHNYAGIKALNHQLKRYTLHQCHTTSRAIIDFAVENEVGIICVEHLKGIFHSGHPFKVRDINQWSYYQLTSMLRYKAQLEGIQVFFVDPRNTSKSCPKCGKINAPKRRHYFCRYCGYQLHRDLVGAMNILNAPVLISND